MRRAQACAAVVCAVRSSEGRERWARGAGGGGEAACTAAADSGERGRGSLPCGTAQASCWAGSRPAAAQRGTRRPAAAARCRSETLLPRPALARRQSSGREMRCGGTGTAAARHSRRHIGSEARRLQHSPHCSPAPGAQVRRHACANSPAASTLKSSPRLPSHRALVLRCRAALCRPRARRPRRPQLREHRGARQRGSAALRCAGAHAPSPISAARFEAASAQMPKPAGSKAQPAARR